LVRLRSAAIGLVRLGPILFWPLVALSACDRKEAASSAPPPEVLVTEVIQKDVPIYAEGIGTTAGYIDAQIRAKVQGYLLSRDYTEGSFVKAGDLLFKIDPRSYQASVDQMVGEVGKAQANYRKTLLDVKRDTPLVAKGAVSQKELDDSIQANEAGKASVYAAMANLKKARLSLEWTKVTSPIDGVAGIANAQIGDLIFENTVMTTVSQVDPIKVLFPISEKAYLKFADRIQLAAAHPTADRPSAAKLELILADGSLYPHPGKVALADRQVETKTGTITIVSYFPNPGNILRPGQYAKVRAIIETRHDAFLVPQRAVQELQGGYQVAVVGPENKVEFRGVKPGVRVGTQWVIDTGLNPGEKVIVEGLQKVHSGMQVTPKPLPVEK
jgi:RND family efflux transporter MFP subunit